MNFKIESAFLPFFEWIFKLNKYFCPYLHFCLFFAFCPFFASILKSNMQKRHRGCNRNTFRFLRRKINNRPFFTRGYTPLLHVIVQKTCFWVIVVTVFIPAHVQHCHAILLLHSVARDGWNIESQSACKIEKKNKKVYVFICYRFSFQFFL